MIPPDLKQNIFYTLYFTIIHNGVAILYFIGILISAFLSLLKPSRKHVLLLLGFSLLLLGFEYNKHILEGLREQTINALITIQEHNKVRRLINIFYLKALPLFLPVTGWVFIVAAIYLHVKGKRSNEHVIEHNKDSK
ncbi:MAG: hypothetical protein WC489_03100 [Patescibacteria group bacterium]